MNPAFGSDSGPGNPGPDHAGGHGAPVKWRHSDRGPPSAQPIPGNKLFQWSQKIILYGHQRNTNCRARKSGGGNTIKCVFSRCVTNLCWKFVFCPLTIFSTDKDPPAGGEKGNRWQSETINSLCCFCVLCPGYHHNHPEMSPGERGWGGWGGWELVQMSRGEWDWSVAF